MKPTSKKVISFFLFSLAMIVCSGQSSGEPLQGGAAQGTQKAWKAQRVPKTQKAPKAANVIFMVADGMGLADVTAARIFKSGPGGPRLHLELNNVGYQRSYSTESLITDSAAAASAWACGEKFRNGEICFRSKDGSHKESVLDLAVRKGKMTGLVVTSALTSATPAAFAAHVRSRDCQNEIARQYIMTTGVDVLLGGGLAKFNSNVPDKCGVSGDFIRDAVSKGYSLVVNKPQMDSEVERGAKRLLGVFAQEELGYEKYRSFDSLEPRLPDMAASALRILERSRKGFFLLIEGSLIDKANGEKDTEAQILETLAFDEAVKVVKDWIVRDPKRAEETLLIIAADHETGGFAITGPFDSLPVRGSIPAAGWAASGHTGSDVMVWSQGPGSGELSRPALENTDISSVIRKHMR
jgi:alkaline phosphatase